MIKLFGLTLFVGLATSLQTLVTGAVFLALGGVAVCTVHADGTDIYLPVPTQLIDAGLLTAHFAMPEEERAKVRAEIEPWRPMIESLTEAVAEMPDGTVLVSVETRDETVRVERRDGRWCVDVRAEDADVHVSIPARSMKRIAGQIGMLI